MENNQTSKVEIIQGILKIGSRDIIVWAVIYLCEYNSRFSASRARHQRQVKKIFERLVTFGQFGARLVTGYYNNTVQFWQRHKVVWYSYYECSFVSVLHQIAGNGWELCFCVLVMTSQKITPTGSNFNSRQRVASSIAHQLTKTKKQKQLKRRITFGQGPIER